MTNFVESSGKFVACFEVQPKLKPGDQTVPLQLEAFNRKVPFFFYGRYNDKKDIIEHVLAGPSGYRYKLSLSDGQNPYGWKVKKHGVINCDSNNMEEAFKTEEIFGIPMAMLRLSTGAVDLKEHYIKPWSFYGPTLPEYFCKCQLKVTILDHQDDAGAGDTLAD